MKQAHLEGVATREQAIAAIEKDLRAFGDDTDQDGDARDAEEGEDDMKVSENVLKHWITSGRSLSVDHLDQCVSPSSPFK